MPDAVGGYFSLEPLSPPAGEFHQDALRVQSARAALVAALPRLQPSRIWVPWFICECIPDVLTAKGIPIARYRLAHLFDVPDVDLRPGEHLLYVNYFGLCSRQAHDLARRYPESRIIVDASQSFFFRQESASATVIYSARKFFGVPDGGYLKSAYLPNAEFPADRDSMARVLHLVQRLAGEISEGYKSFQQAEASLATSEVRAMSSLTKAMLERIDYAAAARRREANFAFLDRHLSAYNTLSGLPILLHGDIPLCYPLLLPWPATKLRPLLTDAGIFVPTYWAELETTLPADAIAERQWVTGLLPLPCDQRYTPDQLQRIVDLLVPELRKRGA